MRPDRKGFSRANPLAYSALSVTKGKGFITLTPGDVDQLEGAVEAARLGRRPEPRQPRKGETPGANVMKLFTAVIYCHSVVKSFIIFPTEPNVIALFCP